MQLLQSSDQVGPLSANSYEATYDQPIASGILRRFRSPTSPFTDDGVPASHLSMYARPFPSDQSIAPFSTSPTTRSSCARPIPTARAAKSL